MIRVITPMIHKITTLTTVLAILSLAACSMFGGGSDPFVDLREQIRSTVHDQERADAMLVSIDQLDQLLLESAELLADVARQERMLFVDYDSTQRDFDLLFSEAARKRRTLQEDMLNAHLEFKSMASAEEWEVILPVHANAVSMRMQSLVVAAASDR